MDFADFTLHVCFAPGQDCGILWREHSVERPFCTCVDFFGALKEGRGCSYSSRVCLAEVFATKDVFEKALASHMVTCDPR